MKKSLHKWLKISALVLFCVVLLSEKEAVAQGIYTDSVTFRIENAQIEGSDLVFSIVFWRRNVDWRGPNGIQDTLLGNTDLYFGLTEEVFDKSVAPFVERLHPNIDRINEFSNLLEIDARYHAGRFAISLRSKTGGISIGMGVVSIPLYEERVELCKIRMRLANPTQNPGLVWDVATGGQSTIGEPLIEELDGDIELNPDKEIVLVDNSRTEYVCEGGEAKIWAKGHSAGTGLGIRWYMSDQRDCVADPDRVEFSGATLGNLVANQTSYAGSVSTAKWGTLSYRIVSSNANLERVDTLIISNVPAGLDSVYFQCELFDETLSAMPKHSTNGNSPATRTQLILRDRVLGWFAASDPTRRTDHATTNTGRDDHTDTIMKCPTGAAIASFYFFGPRCNTDREMIGEEMVVTYLHQDPYGNTADKQTTLKNWQQVPGQDAPNGRCLYQASIELDASITDQYVWIHSIATEAGCDNGGSYALYDTVYIRDLQPEESITAQITPASVAAGETLTLPTEFTYTLIQGTAGGSLVAGPPAVYTAPSTFCSDEAGCADTLVYAYTVDPGDGSSCRMEIRQTVQITSWSYVNIKVLLEGDLMGSPNNNMKGALSALFPTHNGNFVSPYENGDTINTLPLTSVRISDWIRISLRSVSNVGPGEDYTTVAEADAFVLIDGTVVDTKGNPYIRFEGATESNYYIMVHHRNHIGIMSSQPVILSINEASVPTWDFTVLNNIYLQNAAVVNGRAALYAGVAIKELGVVSNACLNAILDTMRGSNMGELRYEFTDINMDGSTSTQDRNDIRNNIKIGPAEIY